MVDTNIADTVNWGIGVGVTTVVGTTMLRHTKRVMQVRPSKSKLFKTRR